MSRHDDTTARQLDEMVDELQHGPGAERDDVAYLFAVPDELGDIAEALQADADRAGHVPPDVARLRTRVLEGAAAHDRRHGRARLPRRARTFNRSLAQRVLVPTMAIMLCVVATTAVGHTDTSVGSAVRTAARTLNLPAPAEPSHDGASRSQSRDEQVPTVAGDPDTGEVDTNLIAPQPQPQSTPSTVAPEDEPAGTLPEPGDTLLDGQDAPKLPPPDDSRLQSPPDGSTPLPPKGDLLPPTDEPKLPPTGEPKLPPKGDALSPPPDGGKLPPPDGDPLPPKQ